MSPRTESVLLALVIVAIVAAMLIVPHTAWWREMQRLVPTPALGAY